MTTARTTGTRTTRRLARIALVAAAAATLAAGCSDSDDAERTSSTGAEAADTSTSSLPDAPTSSEAPTGGDQTGGDQTGGDQTGGDQTGGGQTGGGQTGGGQTGGGQAPATPPPSQAPSTPAPVITSFTTPDDIDCHNGDFQEFTATWTTTNATKVTISIDGPGIYAEYAPNSDTSLPFNCSSPHTFLLTAYGADGQTTTRSVTLQPRNVQVPPDEGGTPE